MNAKKVLSAVLAGSMVLSLAACGSSGSSQTAATQAPAASTEAAAAATEAPAASTEAAAADGQIVGIAMPTKSLERWNRDGSYLQRMKE